MLTLGKVKHRLIRGSHMGLEIGGKHPPSLKK